MDVKLLELLPLRRSQFGRVAFITDLENPYPTFPLEHHLALFEWALNWCVAMQAHQYLMLHAAVVDKGGKALIMPAFPGSGKSTLGAALVLRGWRLLSDEFGLYRPETRQLTPMPRPISLKNESIRVIQKFAPEARFGPLFRGTHKGDVAHLAVPEDSLQRQQETAEPAWIVFPQYKRGTTATLYDFAPGRAFLRLAGNSFNYRMQGIRGFQGLIDMVKRCPAYYLEFDDLDQARLLLDGLAAD